MECTLETPGDKKYSRSADPEHTTRSASEETKGSMSDPEAESDSGDETIYGDKINSIYVEDVLSDSAWSEGEGEDTEEFLYYEPSEPEEEWSECGDDEAKENLSLLDILNWIS